ncbi:MAG: ribosome maturation factor RimP [Fibrobacteres bacterium]|nr:ribosome maturation factor RimP [Fibrobacterota bacterium]
MDLTQDISHRAAKVAESHGLELVDVEIFRAGKRRVLRIYIGKREGVTVSDCAHVSRELGTLLDADNVMQDENYVLEVSSPGLDRPFKSLQDYRRNVGRFVRATLREPIAGLGNKKLVVGKLEDVGEDSIILDTDGTARTIPLGLIVQAKVDVRLG